MSEKQITDFFARYGTALGSGDLPAIAACYATPALVVTDPATTLIATATDVESAFVGSWETYEARELTDAKATISHLEKLSELLAMVAVSWEYIDSQGGTQPGESYRYLVRLGAEPGICVVIPVLSA